MTAGDDERWPDEPAPGGSTVGSLPSYHVAGTVRTERSVTMSEVRDLSVTALESGIGHWAALTRGDYQQDVRFWLRPADPDEDWGCAKDAFTDVEELLVTPETFVRGLQRLADKHPQLFAMFLDDNADAIVADMVLQLGMFGEVVFS